MRLFYLWIESNINRIYRCTMILATFFIGMCIGAIIISEVAKANPIETIVEVPGPVETIEIVRYATEEEEKIRNQEEIEALAKVVWGEARGCNDTQRAAVIWCILNRVDSNKFKENDIISVITAPGQFDGFSNSNPVQDDIVYLVEDVLDRYELEKTAVGNVGRVLPNDYLFFRSNGKGENVFRQNYRSTSTWDWKWGTPYD